MLAKLARLESREAELTQQLVSPEVLANPRKIATLRRELAHLQKVLAAGRRYREMLRQLAGAQALANDSDPALRAMAREEIAARTAEELKLAAEFKRLLLPRDPNDDKNVIIEIRAGTGGDEAALFAADLLRMYSRFAERRGWKKELLSCTETGTGGFKEVILMVSATSGAFARLKYESGVHRVQRVPETEAAGRVHTSAATVAVLPEAEEVDLVIEDKDLRVDTFCASGHGGQSVNTTYSAVRITHLPTGIGVSCQDEKSQIKNRAKAMTVLRSRLLEAERERQAASEAAARKDMVRTGDRSEKIRTYNWPQNRVTDHRLAGDDKNFQLERIVDGDLEEVIAALIHLDELHKLEELDRQNG